tara:strand:+ start:3026 stop:4096 length:1071 start_codon:yes stop_codon:yes gene_type:complete
MKQAITFDDVLIVPTYSEITPDMVDVSTSIGSMELDIPLISAPMDTVTEKTMAEEMSKLGGLGIIHKNMDEQRQLLQVKAVLAGGNKVGVAVSPTKFSKDHIKKMVDAGLTTIVVDSAHGDSLNVIKAVEKIDSIISGLKVSIIAGNVVTGLGAKRLMDAGADVIKVGIGPGSICTTRIVAGVGVPQLTAIIDVRDEIKDTADIIADGGIRCSGDIAKALAAGADAIMLGSLLAGHDESPNFKEVVWINEKRYISYRGMGSEGAMNEGSADRYNQEGAEKFVPEGVEGCVPYRGKLKDTVYQLVGGLKSSMGYCGSKDIKTFKRNANFVMVSPSSLRESHPHNVHNMKESVSYVGQ